MPDNPFADLQGADFIPVVQGLLPTGPVWPRDADAVQTQFFSAVADINGIVHARAADLTERESDPSQTVELLPDWESDWGLPDPCLPLNAGLAQRRAALDVRIAEGEDPTPAYFVALAAMLGFTVTCTQAPSSYGAGWQHVFEFNVAGVADLHAYSGGAVAGDYLEVPGSGLLECVIRRAAPGHAVVVFNYS